MEQMVSGESTMEQVINPDDPLFFNPDHMNVAFDTYIERTGQAPLIDTGSYIRCAYDSLCFSFRYHLEQLERLTGKPVRILHLVGGGSQSEYLCQRTSNICERPVIAGPVEGAVLGNILIQAISMGYLRDLKEGRNLVRQNPDIRTYLPSQDFQPDNERFERYIQLITNGT
jgi:rhamnulokinase